MSVVYLVTYILQRTDFVFANEYCVIVDGRGCLLLVTASAAICYFSLAKESCIPLSLAARRYEGCANSKQAIKKFVCAYAIYFQSVFFKAKKTICILLFFTLILAFTRLSFAVLTVPNILLKALAH